MQRHLEIPFKAPYYTFGELNDQTKEIWVACHGYGQLGEYFVKKFDRFEKQQHFGIVLQGLHKFYFSPQRVGASWMTKHDREVDLLNQFTYFKSVYSENFQGIDLSQYKINLLGFSQGVSAISRFLFHLKIPFDNLILWAGGFPPELPGEDIGFLKDQYRLIVAIGNEDQFYNEENYKINLDLMKETFKKDPEVYQFEGKHTLEPDLLEKWLNP